MRRSLPPNWVLRHKAFAFSPSPSSDETLALARSNPCQVEEQCKDPQLMHCGLEKCVASDGSVEWVAAHSKARLEPHRLGAIGSR